MYIREVQITQTEFFVIPKMVGSEIFKVNEKKRKK